MAVKVIKISKFHLLSFNANLCVRRNFGQGTAILRQSMNYIRSDQCGTEFLRSNSILASYHAPAATTAQR